MAKPDDNEVPRDVWAMVVLHALLSGDSKAIHHDSLVANANQYADAAYSFADAMIERSKVERTA